MLYSKNDALLMLTFKTNFNNLVPWIRDSLINTSFVKVG